MTIRTADIDLDKGSGQLFLFPRRRRVARLQAHRYILDPHRLARLQRQVANDAVALVEEAEHRNPLSHRRDPGLVGGRSRYFDGQRLVVRLVTLFAAGKERQRGKNK